ncbi:hypothetical protein [Cyclobacterium marinum]|uniref:hypothetical protein n=1 Tax=Cyclobacterium marinum TaxID=104 RepID=UPI0011EE697A|nr:hypothetical protein [Cyclobacterium marinum]MBI0397268.1 hypothetical protein [Cyclobacterium marinum]
MINFNKIFYFPILILLSIVFLAGCGEDEEPSGCNSLNWTADLNDELTALSTAISNFGQEPNEANCNSYRQALLAYVNALRPYGNCQGLTGQNRVEWQKLIDEYEEDLNEMDCSDL